MECKIVTRKYVSNTVQEGFHQFLVVKEGDQKWEFPSSSLSVGESPLEACRRTFVEVSLSIFRHSLHALVWRLESLYLVCAC